jgi:hypothetical protein
MRVLIRNQQTAKFLADAKVWVVRRDRALNFVGTVMARHAAARMNLKGVEIVLDFDKPNSDVVLNVPDALENPPRVR